MVRATCGRGTAYPSGAHELTQSLVFVLFDLCLCGILHIFFGHCIVSLFTASDNLFGIFKLFFSFLFSILSTIVCLFIQGPGWLNELGLWIKQLIQAYHQYGVGSRPAL